MEAILVQVFCEISQPDFEERLTFEEEFNFSGSLFEKSKSDLFREYGMLLLNFSIELKDDLELEGEL